MCTWPLLVEEVASHKSQLMSITLIRSSIHGRAQGPIHHARTPRASGTFALSHRLTEVNCHSLKTSYADASMGAQMHTRKHASARRLLHAGILNRNPGIGCLSHLTHYKQAREPFSLFSPHKHVSIASTANYSFRTGDTQQERGVTFIYAFSLCRESF